LHCVRDNYNEGRIIEICNQINMGLLTLWVPPWSMLAYICSGLENLCLTLHIKVTIRNQNSKRKAGVELTWNKTCKFCKWSVHVKENNQVP
jgi:hypothetical protein